MKRDTISVEKLQEMLDERQPVTVLDVRPAGDRVEWWIPGSLHLDAYDALQAGDSHALDAVELPPGQPVVTVCGEGKTSLMAAAQLRQRGVQAVSLAGGMKAWSLAWNVAEVPVPGSQAAVVQVRRTGKGCLSYLIGSGAEAAVVDPALPPAVYMDLARQHLWSITAVLETHIHADHLTRARALAGESGAQLYLPSQAWAGYAFHPLPDGASVPIGQARLKTLHTPGHTPESTAYLLDGWALFTGDTLFLTGVGRPDLSASPAEARQRAHALYGSLQRILGLPPETLILPAHTAQPVDFDGQPVTATLAEVRRRTEILGSDEESFVAWLMPHIPPAPPNHQRILELNAAGQLPAGDPTDLEAGANRCAAG